MSCKIPCIVCEAMVANFNGNELHPIGAVHFFSYGHYGSAYFDPMDGSTLNIIVCDKCLENHAEKTQVIKRG